MNLDNAVRQAQIEQHIGAIRTSAECVQFVRGFAPLTEFLGLLRANVATNGLQVLPRLPAQPPFGAFGVLMLGCAWHQSALDDDRRIILVGR